MIAKRVRPPAQVAHPRGWASERSHQRKLRSYEVEASWYRHHAPSLGAEARVPACYAAEAREGGFLFVLEDLDAAGYPERRVSLALHEVQACLRWLAHFHARFARRVAPGGEPPRGLWPVGTYWHLETRPDELEAMEPGPLRDAAGALDGALRACAHQTLVHGDAKVANFCFSPDGARVAALDFQYVGGGCGMKDVAYLLSCLGAAHCERHAEAHLDLYFQVLRQALPADLEADALEREWRAMWPLAWADFERFLAGWAPHHAKRDRFAARMTQRALDALARSLEEA